MAFGILALSGTQFGKETTSGTAVAATARWRGPVIFPEDDRTMAMAAEDVAIIGKTTRSYVSAYNAKLALPDTNATFEQLGYVFNMGIKGVAGVQDGAGSGYIYTHAFPGLAATTLYTYTIEGFDNNQCYEAEYCFAESFKLTGAGKEPVRVSASLTGRQVSKATLTAGLSLVAVEDILAQKTKLYIDAIGGTIGTTQKTSTLLGWELDVNTGWKAKYTGDGNLYWTDIFQGHYEIKGKLTMELDANDVAQFDNFQAQTPVLMQLNIGGNALTTAGTTYSTKKLILNMPVLWTKFPAPTEADGNNRVDAEFISAYNTTSASAPSFIIVNQNTALA